jgi:hypothetical protein
MAGRIADAQKNRLVLCARFRKRLVIPRKPVHGIVRVLQKVGRFFLREVVRMFDRHRRKFAVKRAGRRTILRRHPRAAALG